MIFFFHAISGILKSYFKRLWNFSPSLSLSHTHTHARMQTSLFFSVPAFFSLNLECAKLFLWRLFRKRSRRRIRKMKMKDKIRTQREKNRMIIYGKILWAIQVLLASTSPLPFFNSLQFERKERKKNFKKNCLGK